MGIGKILSELLSQKNMKVPELSELANVKASTIYSIIQRDNMKVDLDILLSISNVLGVPAEYFKDGTFPLKHTLSTDEKNLLGSYRKLNDLGKHTARIYVDGLTIQKEYQVTPTLKETPSRFDIAASGLDENTEAGKDNMDIINKRIEELRRK